MISCFFDLIRKNLRSFSVSSFLMTERDLTVKWEIREAYCTVRSLSKVLLMAMPSALMTITPCVVRIHSDSQEMRMRQGVLGAH